MATELKRMTFAVTPDMEGLMDEAKRMFYDSTQSEMIRALIIAGLTALKTEKESNSTLKVGEKSEKNKIVG